MSDFGSDDGNVDDYYNEQEYMEEEPILEEEEHYEEGVERSEVVMVDGEQVRTLPGLVIDFMMNRHEMEDRKPMALSTDSLQVDRENQDRFQKKNE